MTQPKENVRAGVLVDDALRRWQVRALEQMVDAGATIQTVLVNQEGGRSLGERVRYNLRKSPGYLLIAGKRALDTRVFGAHPYLQPVPLSDVDVFRSAEWRACAPVSRPDLGQELPDEAVEACRRLDFVVRFGFGILRGEVLTAPKYGVFSYHHGDLRAYRGRPAGFWEFMNDEDTVGVTLQQLTDTLDGGRIIEVEELDISDATSYSGILERLYTGGEELLAGAVRQIRGGEFAPTEPDSLGTIYRAPDLKNVVRFIIKCLSGRRSAEA